jgi:hypothetical protein
VTGTVTYTNDQEASNLVQQLNSGSASSTLQQGTWNSGTPTGVVTEVAEADPVPPVPKTPDPPTGVAMTAYDGNCPTAALDVTFTPPVDKTGILAYTATCYPDQSGRRRRRKLLSTAATATVVQAGASTTSIRVSPLTANTFYKCEVQSVTIDEVSSKAISANLVSTGCATSCGNVPDPCSTDADCCSPYVCWTQQSICYFNVP